MRNRRDFFQAAALQALAGLAGEALAAEKLPNATRGSGEAALTHETFGDQRVYYDGPTEQLSAMTAGSLRLKPGMAPHPPHQHPEEEMMVVTEGTGEISVEGKTTPVSSGSMMYCAGGKLHGIVNTGKTPLLFYYFKWKR